MHAALNAVLRKRPTRVQFTDVDVDGTDTTTFNFTSTLGPGGANRAIFVCLTFRTNNTGNPQVNTMTVDGGTPTLVVAHSINPNNSSYAAIYKIAASAMATPTGTSAAIAITTTASVNRGVGCAVAVCHDPLEDTATATATDNEPADETGPSLSLDNLNLVVPLGGIVIGVMGSYSSSGSYTWTGLSKVYETATFSSSRITTALLVNSNQHALRGVSVESAAPDNLHGALAGVAASFARKIG